MSAYIVVTITVNKPDQFDEYRKLAGPAVAQYGGKYLVRGGARTILEGKFDGDRLVVLEFPSSDDARTFYESPEYRAARDKRAGAADMHMVLVEGV